MIKIRQAVIVEGKYDKIKLASILDAVIIETGGFAIYKDKDKLALIRALAKKTGILILTDADRAGFQIRSYLKGAITEGEVLHAYIPDVLGKEKRKQTPSKEGKLGVEGIDKQSILKALRRAGVTDEVSAPRGERITKVHLYEDGLAGTSNSAQLRRALLRQLDLPERLSANGLVEVLSVLYTMDEYRKAVAIVKDAQPQREGRNE